MAAQMNMEYKEHAPVIAVPDASVQHGGEGHRGTERTEAQQSESVGPRAVS